MKQVVVDYVGGMKDIRKKLIRPIIPPSVIFKDDPVRMIRAVKYATTTGFKLPLTLGWKIKAQAPLLAPISPSRLTEEILKIIHSPYAAKIVENLESYGLYEYLQPNAVKLLKGNPSMFRSRYFKSLEELHHAADPAHREGEAQPGEALAALIRDYLEDFVDWDAGAAENHKAAFAGARQFVLPMNPPRMELDAAVRLIFAEHDITVKKLRFMERGKGRFHERETAAEPELAETPEGPAPVKRRRRRRHRKPPATPTQ
jgi:poly(A) polymerase